LQVQRIFSPSPCALSKNFLFLPTNRIGRQTRAHLAGRFATDSARQAERLNGFTFPSEKNPDWWLAAERLGPNQGTWSFR
jgi:hypothetical protein